jgi:hypothetical protein
VTNLLILITLLESIIYHKKLKTHLLARARAEGQY